MAELGNKVERVEAGAEHIFTADELMGYLKEVASEAIFVRAKYEDEANKQGLYLWEAKVENQESGEMAEYQYMRKGDWGNRNLTEETVIFVTFYGKDGMPISAETVVKINPATGRLEKL